MNFYMCIDSVLKTSYTDSIKPPDNFLVLSLYIQTPPHPTGNPCEQLICFLCPYFVLLLEGHTDGFRM